MVKVSGGEKYWVVGGQYTDTDFEELVEGYELEEYGPFDTEEEAYDKWKAMSWRNVDTCSHRYEILTEFELDCSDEEKSFIVRAAERKGMTINEFIIYAVEVYMEDHPLTRKDFEDISE